MRRLTWSRAHGCGLTEDLAFTAHAAYSECICGLQPRKPSGLSVSCGAADTLRERVVDQIDQWLSLPPQNKRQWMDGLLETVVLDDLSHPAYRRFKELYEPLGFRKEERAQQYKKVCLTDAVVNISSPAPPVRMPSQAQG